MCEDLTTCFLRDGFVRLDGAVPAELALRCADLLWAEIGYDPGDPATWVEPVRWVPGMSSAPFAAAANTPALVAAFDTLVGTGRWERRASLGSFPLRFPHPVEPDDAGWHVEGSYQPEGAKSYWLNLSSRGRALLMLFLFSDVGERDAPTRIRVGSHVDIPPLLVPYGERGVSMFRIAAEIDAASAHRPVALATGRAGDVYLCHPFLVHAAQPHHGDRPRFMAQPPLYPAGPLELERPAGDYSPVELAIREGLTGSQQATP
ncbi:MAG TPA: phytanoyl-CoA dioxygenase [Pseudonocardia sp.]|nr:phytanoyl-CoA dioxygenase [Pseudonocardia sp.]